MGGKILYQKKYPRITLDTLKKDSCEDTVTLEDRHKNIEEILTELNEGRSIVRLPEREEGANTFIAAAKELSTFYELDIVIEEFDSHISVTLSFDCGGSIKDIGGLFAMADQVSFFTHIHNRDIAISLDYFTHAEFRHSRLCNP